MNAAMSPNLDLTVNLDPATRAAAATNMRHTAERINATDALDHVLDVLFGQAIS